VGARPTVGYIEGNLLTLGDKIPRKREGDEEVYNERDAGSCKEKMCPRKAKGDLRKQELKRLLHRKDPLLSGWSERKQ